MTKIRGAFTLFLISAPVTATHAAETAAYTYDAKGRLVKVVKSGGPINGTTTTYNVDKADNRVRVTVSGAPR